MDEDTPPSSWQSVNMLLHGVFGYDDGLKYPSCQEHPKYLPALNTLRSFMNESNGDNQVLASVWAKKISQIEAIATDFERNVDTGELASQSTEGFTNTKSSSHLLEFN